MELTGKSAIVTGGGTGLGRAICFALARRGCRVAINYSRSEREAVATAEEVAKLGVQAIAIQADVTQVAEVRGMAERTLDAFGRVDVLVNNAGTTAHVPMGDLDAISGDLWDRIMDVNAKGAFLCCQAVVQAMRAQKSGRIVNIASISGLMPEGSSLPYCASKAAMLMVTKCLALGLAPDILVNAVAPGPMLTRWWDARPPAVAEHLADNVPIGRVISLEDVAEAVILLTSTDSITGHTIVLDGGISLR